VHYSFAIQIQLFTPTENNILLSLTPSAGCICMLTSPAKKSLCLHPENASKQVTTKHLIYLKPGQSVLSNEN